MSSTVDANPQASSPPVVEVESLLAALPGDNPAGRSQQYSGLYDEIRAARRADDALAPGEWVREVKTADWAKTAALAADALATQTKDLQICAWLAEALVKLHGFAGLRDALRVMHGLHENFWDRLYPEEDAGDLEARANAVSWMERQAAAAVREVPLVRGPNGERYDYNRWEESNVFNVGPEVGSDLAEERRRRAAEEGKVTSDDWARAKASTPRAFYESLYAALSESAANLRALDSSLDGLYGNQAPSLGELSKAVEAVRGVVEKIVREKRLLEPDPISEEAGAGDAAAAAAQGNGHAAGAAPAATSAAAHGPIRTRQEAVNRLKEVAAFFRQTEPQSPVSYLVERAVSWSQMPLERWLASVIKDSTVLESLRETLGVEKAAGE